MKESGEVKRDGKARNLGVKTKAIFHPEGICWDLVSLSLCPDDFWVQQVKQGLLKAVRSEVSQSSELGSATLAV